MTPKEKAKELYRKYWVYFTHEQTVNSIFKHAKQCALIAQQNLLQKLKELNIYDLFEEEVYKEIEKL